MNLVYIIIVNWNGWKDTIECLESLLLLNYQNFRIVVCDNGSTDESLVMLEKWAESTYGLSSENWQLLDKEPAEQNNNGVDALFTLIKNGINLGFGAGTNVGLRYTLMKGDAAYCWLLNNDTVVDPSALLYLVKRLSEKVDAGMCGSTLRDYQDRSKIQALGGAIYFKWVGIAWHIGRTVRGNISVFPELIEAKVDYIVGSSLLVRTSFLKDIGLLAEDYFLYFEELDWALRGRIRYSLAYAPMSIVYHKYGVSIGTATNPHFKSFTCDYYTLRNRIVFTRRYYPPALVGVYVGLLIELIIRLLFGRWDLAGMIGRLIINGVTASDQYWGRTKVM